MSFRCILKKKKEILKNKLVGKYVFLLPPDPLHDRVVVVRVGAAEGRAVLGHGEHLEQNKKYLLKNNV